MKRLMAIALVALLGFAPEPASAQAVCGSRGEITQRLTDEYGEVWSGGGIAMQGQLAFEIWTNPETGTWTILRSAPDGQTCAMAVGEGWNGVKGTKGKDA